MRKRYSGKRLKGRCPFLLDHFTLLGFINRSKKGLSVKQLKAKIGFDDKKIANLVYKAKKDGKIKNAGKGVYVKS